MTALYSALAAQPRARRHLASVSGWGCCNGLPSLAHHLEAGNISLVERLALGCQTALGTHWKRQAHSCNRRSSDGRLLIAALGRMSVCTWQKKASCRQNRGARRLLRPPACRQTPWCSSLRRRSLLSAAGAEGHACCNSTCHTATLPVSSPHCQMMLYFEDMAALRPVASLVMQLSGSVRSS